LEGVPGIVRSHLAYIEVAARRTSEMIGTLIDFARSRFGGSLPVVRAPADLHAICGRVIDELTAGNPGRRIEMDPKGDGRGEWDEARLGQVVSNLVGNALLHGERDEPVRVSVEGGDSEALLRVQNRGTPIPADLLPVLFGPFRRGSDSRGLGLGLYIVRQIVVAHGGTVEVESTGPWGTTFIARLPRSASATHGAAL
jgi:signal transduction histidine kinase